jgi:ferritin-like metal-binding protein YciE
MAMPLPFQNSNQPRHSYRSLAAVGTGTVGATYRLEQQSRRRAMGWFSPDLQTMKDLFLHSMQDIYYAEHQIEKALPDMVEKASDAELKKGFRTHLKQTKGQIKRLDQAFKKLKVTPEGTKCPAIDGIIDEAKEIAGEIEDKMVLNAALIAAAQAVEHYEITRYGTLVAWAKLLGRNDVAKVLNMNLKEEKATDKKLNGIAKRKINRKAAARNRKRPDAVERAENSMLVAAAGIPAV